MTKQPCRVCSDFKNWSKEEKSKSKEEQSNENAGKQESKKNVVFAKITVTEEKLPCPPDSLELGSSTWTFLHTMASYYPDTPEPTVKEAASQLLNSLSLLYPCSYCAKHLREELQQNPPVIDNRSNLEKYLCDLHNEVNERLGKPLFDCSRVRERWRDGPKDGSCG